MRKNLVIIALAVALIGFISFEGYQYWTQHKATAADNDNPWVVESVDDHVQGTSKTVIHRMADGESKHGTYSPATFVLHCPSGVAPYAYIYGGGVFAYRVGYNTFSWRFDNREPEEGDWKVGDDYRTDWPEDGFLQSAVQSKSLWLKIPTEENRFHELHFDLAGLDELYRQHCTVGAPSAASSNSAIGSMDATSNPRPQSDPVANHSGGDGQSSSAGGQWIRFVEDGKSSFFLPSQDSLQAHNVDTVMAFKCGWEHNPFFIAAKNFQFTVKSGEAVTVTLTLNNADVSTESMRRGTDEDGQRFQYLYPSDESANAMLLADSVELQYDSSTGGRASHVFHPKGLNRAEVKAVCGW